MKIDKMIEKEQIGVFGHEGCRIKGYSPVIIVEYMHGETVCSHLREGSGSCRKDGPDRADAGSMGSHCNVGIVQR